NPLIVARRRGEVVDVSFHRAPARKPVFAGDVALGGGELRRGIVRAQRDEPVLGGFPQPFEIGLGRQRLRGRKSLWPDVPSLFAPGDRGSRARKKEDVQRSAGGGLNPLRGPSVACSTDAETSAGGRAESICASFLRSIRRDTDGADHFAPVGKVALESCGG